MCTQPPNQLGYSTHPTRRPGVLGLRKHPEAEAAPASLKALQSPHHHLPEQSASAKMGNERMTMKDRPDMLLLMSPARTELRPPQSS